MTPYEEVFNYFNIATQFYDLDAMAEADRDDFLARLMDSAISEITAITFDFTRNDTTKQFESDLPDVIKKIVAEYMIFEWTGRYLHDQDLLEQYMSTNAIKMFSPAAHISQLREVNNKAEKKAQRLQMKYSIKQNISRLG